jgi:hypothetical protein
VKRLISGGVCEVDAEAITFREFFTVVSEYKEGMGTIAAAELVNVQTEPVVLALTSQLDSFAA